MNNTIKTFTDLYSWQESHKLVLMVYKLLRKFPNEEKFALCDQMRRASISITSNIAEGFGRQTIKEKIQFYYQAQGSLTEIKNQLITSKDLDYIDRKDFDVISSQADIAHQLLQGLITKSKSFIHKSSPIHKS
jgi:four helix bundle protein